MSLILASGSPRRRELLDQIGVRFQVDVSSAEELWRTGESPADYVVRVARSKAQAVVIKYPPGIWILGADTEVVLEQAVFGKPASQADACRMLRQLSGQTHEVLTAVCLLRRASPRAPELEMHSCLVSTKVSFRELSAGEIDAYWRTGEPAGKAGGYAIQGLGAMFVNRIEGSFTGVVGLPLAETAALFDRVGIATGLSRSIDAGNAARGIDS